MADTNPTQATLAPKASFFPEKPEQTAAPTPVVKEGTQTEASEKPKTKPTMVIDANVLIKSADLQALTQKYTLATVAQAVKEVRDPNARMRLGTIMGDLKIVIPGKEHLAKVADFAKKTGDCVSISVTDANLIALAIMLIEQKGNLHMIRKEPARAEDFGGDPSQETAEGTLQGEHEDDQSDSQPDHHPDGQQTDIPDANTTSEEVTQATAQSKEDEVDPDEEYQKAAAADDDGWMVASAPVKAKEVPPKRERKSTEDSIASKSVAITSNALTPVTKTPNPEEVGQLAPQLWYEDKDFEQEDEEGWITPSNLKDVVQGSEIIEVSQLESIGVGVMTADFAMQMGIPLLSVEGMIIKKVKSYVLECFTCLHLCRDNSKVFCPNCGHSTLLRVTCSFNKDGSFILYRKKGFQVSNRGMRYAIPRPKGGQNSDDLILSQDDLNRVQQRLKYHSKLHTHDQEMRQAEEAYEYAYGLDGITKTARTVNLKPGYGRTNPNDNGFRKKTASKKG